VSGRRSTPGLTLAGLVAATLAFSLMQTILIPALSTLQRDLGTTEEWVTWTVSAYLLSGSVATPLLGKLGDQHGKRRMMLISLGVFLVGSLGAIVAPNVAVLIACRVVQGSAARFSRWRSPSSATSSRPSA
jgi:MFS family permease